MNIINSKIPQELKEYNQWVLWKLESNIEGRTTKMPYSKRGSKASVSDPSTWMSFEDAYATYTNSTEEYSGLGFVFSDSDPFIGFDWDHVCDPETKEFDPGIPEEIKNLNSYAEISQSGKGAHVIAKGTMPGSKHRKDAREIYDRGRFFVVTGNHIEGTPLTINEATHDAVMSVYSKIDSSSNDGESIEESKQRLTDSAVIEKCKNAANGDLFDSLYGGNWHLCGGYDSQSNADLALCNLLAVYTRDPRQIDRIFSGSGLYRDKWDRTDYKDRTISKALDNVVPAGNNPREKYFDGARFVVKSLAEEIMEENHFFTLDDTEAIYHYDKGVYRLGGEKIIKRISQGKLGDYYRNSYVTEVLSYIKIGTQINRSSINQEARIINLNNGLYDLKTNTFGPHTPALLSTIRIPVDYDPDAECPNIEKFLSEIVSPEDKQVLVEWAGYSMIPDTRMQKSVMLLGNGSNGKSVFLKLLTLFIGGENTSSESLQKLERDRFSSANLYGKLINVFPDLARTSIYEDSTFKSLCGDDRIRGERKFEGAFEFENTARLIFSANTLPSISNGDFAYFRRWILIEFPNIFEGTSADKYLINKLRTPEELSGFLNKALTALKVLLENDGFSYNKTVEDVKRMYQINSDSVAAFAEECVESGHGDTSKQIMYEEYEKWCKINDIEPVKNNIFGKVFKDLGFTYSRESTGDREYYWDEVTVISKE